MVEGLKTLDPADKDRVNAAIASAQARTHARFSFVVVPASDRYQLYPILWGAVVAFVAFGLIALFVPRLPIAIAFAIVSGIFVVLSLILEWGPIRFRLVPKRVRHAHARVLAHREFATRILAHREHGILFFVSLAERYSEIIADHALHQAAGQAAWDKIVADFTAVAARGKLADAIANGANACGALLEEHHPKG